MKGKERRKYLFNRGMNKLSEERGEATYLKTIPS